MLKNCRSQGLPERKAGNASACARLAHPGRGHRPCRSARLILGPPGAQSPRPAPAPPPAGASRPPGRALASVGVGGTGPGGSVPRGRGKRSAFPLPVRTDESTFTAAMAGAIAPATSARRSLASRGAKAPGQRPPRPRRALLARRVGRWPPVVPVAPVLVEASHAGGETQCVSCSRPPRRKHLRRCHGRGHRPCHSATLILGPPGAQSPRPAPAPPPAGASRPPGRALAFVGAGCTGLGGSVARGRGNAMRFLFPPGGAFPFPGSGRFSRQAGDRIAVSAPC
jgi:hypothetical protein